MKQPNEEGDLGQPTAEQHQQDHGSELERLRTECAQLRQQVQKLTKERDDYLKMVYHYVLAEITEEDVERYAKEDEDGLPFEAFFPELEKILQGEAEMAGGAPIPSSCSLLGTSDPSDCSRD